MVRPIFAKLIGLRVLSGWKRNVNRLLRHLRIRASYRSHLLIRKARTKTIIANSAIRHVGIADLDPAIVTETLLVAGPFLIYTGR